MVTDWNNPLTQPVGIELTSVLPEQSMQRVPSDDAVASTML